MKKTKVTTNPAKTESVETSRRSFLRTGIAATGGVAATVAINGNALAASEEVVEQPAVKDEGYRVTEHVAQYYKSAEV